MKQFSTGVRESSFMSDNNKMRSILEIMNDVLSTVRDYYDSEYAYYIEKDEYEILTIYEWCAEADVRKLLFYVEIYGISSRMLMCF